MPLVNSHSKPLVTDRKNKKKRQERTLKFDIRFRMNKTNYEIAFVYNLATDNPAKSQRR